MKCENCSKDHIGDYGSGRFCGVFCARGFSSKEKRLEINKQVSLKLKGRVLDPNKKYITLGKYKKLLRSQNCVICKSTFETYTPKIKTCSQECYSKFQSSVLKGRTGGPRKGGGFGKHSDYITRNNEIVHCQSNMEYKFCEILESLRLNWCKNITGWTYTTIEGKIRKYYPDFYIKDYDKYIELKGYVTAEMTHKMLSANIPNLVIIATQKYGGYWEKLIDNPKLLIDKIAS